jgi:hypothetical protein
VKQFNRYLAKPANRLNGLNLFIFASYMAKSQRTSAKVPLLEG